MSPELTELLQELSQNTQAIGRRIGSPKNTPEDLTDLIVALHHTQEALITVRTTMMDAHIIM